MYPESVDCHFLGKKSITFIKHLSNQLHLWFNENFVAWTVLQIIGSQNDMKLNVFSQSMVKNDEFYYQILYKSSILDSLIAKILMGRIFQNKLDFCKV